MNHTSTHTPVFTPRGGFEAFQNIYHAHEKLSDFARRMAKAAAEDRVTPSQAMNEIADTVRFMFDQHLFVSYRVAGQTLARALTIFLDELNHLAPALVPPDQKNGGEYFSTSEVLELLGKEAVPSPYGTTTIGLPNRKGTVLHAHQEAPGAWIVGMRFYGDYRSRWMKREEFAMNMLYGAGPGISDDEILALFQPKPKPASQ